MSSLASMSVREGEVKRFEGKDKAGHTRAEELETLIERDKRAGQAVNRYEASAELKGNFELRKPITKPNRVKIYSSQPILPPSYLPKAKSPGPYSRFYGPDSAY